MSTTQHPDLPLCVKSQFLLAFSYIRHKNIFKIKFVCHNFIQSCNLLLIPCVSGLSGKNNAGFEFPKKLWSQITPISENCIITAFGKNRGSTLCILNFGKR
jgi:hypothetical protein